MKRIIIETSPENTYSTFDLYLAAYLRCLDFPFRAVTAQNNRSVFLFDDPEGCEEAARDWANEADDAVKPTRYARELQRIKGIAVRGRF